MPSLKKIAALCATPLLAAAIALPALSQQPDAQGPVIKANVNLVNLFVTVRDKNKRIVTDLKQEDFKVARRWPGSEDRLLLQRSDAAHHSGVALDTSGSEQYMLGAIQDWREQLLEPRDAQGRRSHDHVALTRRRSSCRFHRRSLAAQSRHPQSTNQHRRWGRPHHPGTIPQSGSKGTQFLRCSLFGV